MAPKRAGILDQFVAISAESVYGQAATAFNRVVPANNDSWEPEIQEVSTSAHRPGRQAMQADQSIQIPVGGTGSIETMVAEAGMFLLMRDLLDEWSSALGSVANSNLKTLTLKSNALGPRSDVVSSLSALIGRADVAQARRESLYAGCMVTDWELAGSVGEPIMLTINYDWAADSTRTQSLDNAYSAPSLSKIIKGPFYSWRDLSISVDGDQLATLKSFSLTGNRGLDTERRYLQGTSVKAQPQRNTVPEYGLVLECDLDAKTREIRDLWGSDGLTGEIVVTLTGRTDQKTGGSDAIYPSIAFTMATAKVEGDEPAMELEGPTGISLNLAGKDLGDGSTPALQCVIAAAQTAID